MAATFSWHPGAQHAGPSLCPPLTSHSVTCPLTGTHRQQHCLGFCCRSVVPLSIPWLFPKVNILIYIELIRSQNILRSVIWCVSQSQCEGQISLSVGISQKRRQHQGGCRKCQEHCQAGMQTWFCESMCHSLQLWDLWNEGWYWSTFWKMLKVGALLRLIHGKVEIVWALESMPHTDPGLPPLAGNPELLSSKWASELSLCKMRLTPTS